MCKASIIMVNKMENNSDFISIFIFLFSIVIKAPQKKKKILNSYIEGHCVVFDSNTHTDTLSLRAKEALTEIIFIFLFLLPYISIHIIITYIYDGRCK